MTRGKQLLVLLGILVSGLFLWLAFRQLQPEAFLDALGQVNWLLLLLGAGVYFGAVVVIALRWGYLLRALVRVPLRNLFPLVCIGYMGNNVYPFRAGEVLRLVLLRRAHRVPLARGATTVLVERVFDGLVMLSFILVGVLALDVVAAEVRVVAGVAAPAFLGALVVFLLLAARPEWLRSLTGWLSGWLPGAAGKALHKLGEEVLHGLEGLRSPFDLAGAVVTSYLTWAIEAVVYWIVMFAFGLEFGYPAALLVVGVVNLAGLIPASPGQLGVYEFFVSAVLVSLGTAESTALAYAIVVHLVIWLPVTLVGFFFLAQMGLGVGALRRAGQLQPEISEQLDAALAANNHH